MYKSSYRSMKNISKFFFSLHFMGLYASIYSFICWEQSYSPSGIYVDCCLFNFLSSFEDVSCDESLVELLLLELLVEGLLLRFLRCLFGGGLVFLVVAFDFL